MLGAMSRTAATEKKKRQRKKLMRRQSSVSPETLNRAMSLPASASVTNPATLIHSSTFKPGIAQVDEVASNQAGGSCSCRLF